MVRYEPDLDRVNIPRQHEEDVIDLDALLKPRSVAVLGASERPSVGRTIVENLDRIGFAGPVYPINPKYETLLGRRCYPSVEALPDDVHMLAFCVNHQRVLEGLRPAADRRSSGDARRETWRPSRLSWNVIKMV